MHSDKICTMIARAKVNLVLHICNKQPDGVYHEIDSIAVFPDIGDTITAVVADSWGLTITGEFSDSLDTVDNLILTAAQKVSPDQPYHFTLEKNLPVAAGIGGGSADAAAVLRILKKPTMKQDILALGADVPVCLFSKPARMQGIGEKLTPILSFPECARSSASHHDPVWLQSRTYLQSRYHKTQ